MKFKGIKIEVEIPSHCIRNIAGQVIQENEIGMKVIQKIADTLQIMFPGIEGPISFNNDIQEIQAKVNAPDTMRPLAQYVTGLFPRIYDTSLTLVLDDFGILYSYKRENETEDSSKG